MYRKVIGVLVAVLLFSCSVEERTLMDGRVSFSFDYVDVHVTKSVEDGAIKDLNLYIVGSEGAVLDHLYTGEPESATARIYKGNSYTVYAIANAGTSLPAKTAHEIEALSLSYGSSGTGFPQRMVMAGKTQPQILSDGDRVTVPLQRTMARILVKGDFSQLSPGVSIDIRRVMLKNVPTSISLYNRNAIAAASGAADGPGIENPTLEEFHNGLEFFQYENMQGTLLPDNTDQKRKVWPVESLYSRICSYVYMEADYHSEEKEGSVIYRFYLGSDMISNYDVQRNRQYNVTVFFRGNGGIDENTWRVDSGGLVDILPAEISFAETQVPMYDLEERNLDFAVLERRGRELQVSSSDNSVLQVLGYGDDGVKVKALAPGVATVTASVNCTVAQCRIDVEKLRVVPSSSSVPLFNHFYHDLEYEILPPHASSLGVGLKTAATSLAVGYGGVQNRIIPQYDMNTPLPLDAEVTISVAGRPDVSATVPVRVNPMISAHGNVAVNANMGNNVTVKDIGLKTSPHAVVSTSWTPSDGISIYGTPPEGVSYSDGKIMVDVPTAANGRYRLVCNVVGDDGYGTLPNLQADAVAYCNVDIYETVYLVGVSKTHGRERLSVSPDRWKYSNEVVAKWFSHPRSLIFPNGEVQLSLSFIYNGVEYSDSHTAFYEEKVFEFEMGETYDYAMDKGSFVYKGTPPKCYYQYFFLQPASTPYIEGSLPDNTPYIYICSRNFASGFGKDDAPGWSDVFEYIYPKVTIQ